MTADVAAYVAGITDGEGCIRIFKRPDGRHRPEVRIVNTSEKLIVWLHQNVGGESYYQRDKTHPLWKPRWQWVVTGAKALSLIEAIRPWLVIKREHADVILSVKRFYEPVTTKRPWSQTERDEATTAFLLLKKLNKRGTEEK